MANKIFEEFLKVVVGLVLMALLAGMIFLIVEQPKILILPFVLGMAWLIGHDILKEDVKVKE